MSVKAYRDARPVQDRRGYWELLGPRPEFELQAGDEALPQGWVSISFDVFAEGHDPHDCVLTIQTTSDKQRLSLGNHRRFSGVVPFGPDVRSIRILLIGADGQVYVSPIALRPSGKVVARLRILTKIIIGRRVSLRQVANEIRTALRVTKSDGLSALLPWLIKLYLYGPGLDFLPPAVSADLDLFNDTEISAASCLGRDQFLWSPQQGEAIDDMWSAARYCIDLLRGRADLRKRFPHALSAGPSGAFARWLSIEGRELLHLKAEAYNFIQDAFRADLANHIRQIYLTRDDLQTQFPFALTPAGQREFFHWLLREGHVVQEIRLETIWWFLLENAEDPSAELVRTYLFTPEWQRLVPEGVTIFGRAELAAWLVNTYRLDGKWTEPCTWPLPGTSAQAVRLAYARRADWQRRHPRPFQTLESARAFLGWLTTAESGLTGEALAWCRGIEKGAVAEELIAGGINIIGHFCYPSGLRTSVEMITEGLKRVGLGVALRDLWSGDHDDPHHEKFNDLEYYDITLIHAEPEPFFDAAYRRSGLLPRSPRTYRIAYWYWELEDNIPPSWMTREAPVDEVWVATKFVADAMRKHFDVPIRQMMPGFDLPVFTSRPRSYFNLPEDRFIFLFVFHMMSVMERKNPLGLIEAYRRAFESDDRVLLVVKTSFGESHLDYMAQLHAAAAEANTIVIDAIHTKDETLSLMAAADCYVSLHRSEGWGLTMAEAMLLGKPVIATGYSGNMDFMDSSNSLLVDHRIVTLERDYPPYAQGAHWADPSIDHAARLMRQVFDNQVWARDLGAKAQCDLRSQMSLEVSGRHMAARLVEIAAERNTGH